MRCKDCKLYRQHVRELVIERRLTDGTTRELDYSTAKLLPQSEIIEGPYKKYYPFGTCDKVSEMGGDDLDDVIGISCTFDDPSHWVGQNFGCIHFEHKDGKNLLGTMNSGDKILRG